MTFNAELFDRAAAAYDENPPFFRTVGQRLVDFARLPSGADVLDVGAGKGAVTVPALRAVGSTGRVTAVDVSEAMVAALVALELPGLDVRRSDVTDLPFPDAAFDHAVSGFTLHIVADLAAALQEIHRVLRPGGTLTCSLAGTHPDAEEWQAAYGQIFADFSARLEDVPQAMSPLRDLDKVIAASGFDVVDDVRSPVSLPVGGAAQYWAWTQTHGARWLSDALPPAGAAELRAAVIDSLERLHPTQGRDILVAPRFLRLR